jgi:molybdopterin converting factor subunit 1
LGEEGSAGGLTGYRLDWPDSLVVVTVELLYFGMLKDYFEAERDVFELPSGSSVEELLELLRRRMEAELPVWRSLAVAVNREYALPSTVLHEGDEVALLPPVSGGWR